MNWKRGEDREGEFHMFRILIIEDDEVIRSELKLMLRNAGYAACALAKFSDIPAQAAAFFPDLILLDVQLPGVDGLKICREIRKESDVPVIFVTGKSTDMDELLGMMAGGDDYITKPYVEPVLLAHISAVLRRAGKQGQEGDECQEEKEGLSGNISGSIYRVQGCELNLARGSITYDGRTAELTRNELRICYNLFSRCGEIVSREDIIDDLWDNQMFIDDNTLSVNVTRIRAKLKEIGAGDLIKTKRGQGYRI